MIALSLKASLRFSAAMLLAAPLLAAAQTTIPVTVQTTGPSVTISKDIYGQFAEHLGRCVYGGFWAEPGLNVPQQGHLRSASKDKAGLVHISLVNLDPTKTLNLETALPGVSWKTATGRILTSAKVNDYSSFDKPGTVQLAAFTGAKKRGDKLSVALPPKSIVVLELR